VFAHASQQTTEDEMILQDLFENEAAADFSSKFLQIKKVLHKRAFSSSSL
jgi:hypothetical protein